MLQSLHVKNLALIEETEIQFGDGLNIITGETGAGKSLLIGSINLALGSKFEKDMLRKGADNALVELVFVDKTDKVRDRMKELDLELEEDGTIIISRRMQIGKNVYKINGETVTAKQVRALSDVLIDIYGQHEHQSLLHMKKHLEVLDAYCGEELVKPLAEVSEYYKDCCRLRRLLEEQTMDDAKKAREQSLAEYECQEIEEACLTVGEDEMLEQQYRLMVNSKKITEGLMESYQYTGNSIEQAAGNSLSRALRSLRGVTAYDDRLVELERQLAEIDCLLADYNRDLSEYMTHCNFEEEEYLRVEERLNCINRLKEKYGRTIEEIMLYGEEQRRFLEKLLDYDLYMKQLQEECSICEEKLRRACEKISEIRRKNAFQLSEILKNSMIHLNFLTVEFEIMVRPEQKITANGYDEVEFLISTNPGEELKPLGQVASGGELSRIMLAIKTVLAEKDGIGTLIFDEIDTGISGKTAWRVSEELDTVAHEQQVICITHLPQIAAMADVHFVIEKSSSDENTLTELRRIQGEESLGEMARLLGSDVLTEAALINAKEMRQQANQHKKERKK